MATDPGTEIALEAATKIVTNILDSAIKGVGDRFSDWKKERDFFGIAAKRYAKRLLDRYDEVKVLGMNRPVSLRSLYVRVNILEKITARESVSAQELEQYFDRDRRSFGVQKETVEGEAIVNKLQRFIVLGKPGAGKSTFLKYLALQSIAQDSKIERKRLPVFISLHEYAQKEQSLMDFIVKQFDICRFPEAEPFLERVLEKGECLILLDGMDEVGQEQQDAVIQEILDFSDKYSDNQFVISCRVAAYNHWFQRFTDVEMADFNEAQMQQFIENWFREEPGVAEECWGKLKDSAQLKELATIPLLLTLLCITYHERLDFPHNRAELYEEAIDALLKKWDASRRIQRSEVYKNLSHLRKKQLFAEVAARTFADGQYFIPKRVLTAQIQTFIAKLPGVKEEQLEPDSEAILQAIEAHHGILVTRARQVYSFSHLTLQEYFTAKYIVDHNRTGQLIEHLHDSKWQEVFQLVASMLPNADAFFEQMEAAVRALAQQDGMVRQLVQDANRALLPDDRWPYAFWRGVAVLVLLARAREARYGARYRDLALARALACALARALDRDLAQALAQERVRDLDLEQDRDLDLALVVELVVELAVDRVRGPNILKSKAAAYTQLGQEELAQIEAYLEANLLMLQCLQTDCMVSSGLRERLLAGMLALPEVE